MKPKPRRRGHPLLLTAMDVWSSARSSGRWLLLVLTVLTALAAAAASVGHLLPWLIYPAL